MNLKSGQAIQDLLPGCSCCRRNGQQDFLDIRLGDQFCDVLGGVHRQPAYHPPDQTGVVVDEGLGFIHSPQTQRRQQLIACRSSTENRYRHAGFLIDSGLLRSRTCAHKPVTHEVLTGSKAQAADQQQR